MHNPAVPDGTRTIAVLVTIAFCVIGVLVTTFPQLASAREQSLRTSLVLHRLPPYASPLWLGVRMNT